MPYNPGITYKGADYFYNAISGAGDDIAQGIRRYSDERKKDKAVDAAFGAMEPWLTKATEQGYLEPGILAKYAAAARGTADQKQGILTGLGQVLTFANKVQDMSLARDRNVREAGYAQLAQAQDTREAATTAARLGEYDAASKARERLQGFNQRLAQSTVTEVPGVAPYPTPQGLNLAPWAGGQPMRIERPMTPQRMLKAGAEAGVLTPENIDNLTVAGARSQPKEVRVKEKDGVRWLESDTGQFQVVAAGQAGPGEALPMLDRNGKVIAYGFPNGKGGYVYRSAQSEVRDGTPITDPQTGESTGYIYINGKPVKVSAIAALQALMGGRTNAPAGVGVRSYDPATGTAR